jgi:TatD DNase family protein
MTLCDTHTHLYLEEFDADRDETVQRAVDAGVGHIFLPNIDSTSAEAMLSLSGRHPSVCFPMMGLHPTSVKADYEEELAVVERYLEAPPQPFAAVGEIGIDLYWSRTFETQQCDAFNRQLDLAVRHRLPVAVHTRNSFDLAAGIIGTKTGQGLKGIFHCFGGSLAQARRAVELGFLLGIGGVITYKNSGLQQVVQEIPLEHLVLETDAPFLPPVPYRGQRNESAFIPLIAQRISELKQVPAGVVARVTTENALRLFNRSNPPS